MTANLPDPRTDQEAPSHHDGPDTERDAASLIRPKAGNLRALALEALHQAGGNGLTDSELAEVTGKYLYTIAPRRGELVASGWAIDSGERRKSAQGRASIVWRLTRGAQARLDAEFATSTA